MYKVTLKPKKGKSYDVGGTIFKAAVPRTVSEKLGEYLKNNDSFEVVQQLGESEDDFVNHEVIEPEEQEKLAKIYSEKELEKLSKSEQEDIIFMLAGDASTVKNGPERIALILQLQEEVTKPEGE
ncbi:YqbF domain-containing protein [Alkalicoccobacillus plakortidis]|uniref:Phage protein n=1 Tax=Alkalicoccobacillus plakortidis TaxID=444060 RepID=A0ABT0XDV7_9BACI|nr:YqbF domain-containing protein [Alkalicoccobacillus plakortidis]MCM2674088.1 hypothetical protein [Alkalicoccobacillus plakortidis]